MNYIYSLANNVKEVNQMGTFIALFLSCKSFSLDETKDKLFIILNIDSLSADAKKILDKEWIILVDLEKLKDEISIELKSEGIFNIQEKAFMGIYYASFYAVNKIDGNYIMIENDIFFTDPNFKLAIPDNSKVTFFEGRPIHKKNTFHTTTLIYFCPVYLKNKVHRIYLDILKKFLNSRSLWSKFNLYFDSDFNLYPIMSNWTRSKDNKLIHRNNIYFQKEFTKFEYIKINLLIDRAIEMKFKFNNVYKKNILCNSKRYYKLLKKISKQNGFTLPMRKKEHKLILRNFIKRMKSDN